jgi:hypothetical protein
VTLLVVSVLVLFGSFTGAMLGVIAAPWVQPRQRDR